MFAASKASPWRCDSHTRFEHKGSFVELKEVLVEFLYQFGLLVGDTESLEVNKGSGKPVNLLPTRNSP